ncbi:uncharacterized protein [Henckelia pumila]|uniref:uncharacterized protein n=1 Tax=Henckelia pumila TaxID=405737 RepID=UPI003C6E8436
MVGYYRRLVENFSHISKPLTQLTKKDLPFVWTSECEESFHELRRRLTTAPVLALPYGSGGYVVHTDAFLQGLGCVLSQRGHVISYAFRRVVVPDDFTLREEILTQAHRSRFSVHPESMKMNCDAILVVVDRLSKSAHFLSYNRDFTFDWMTRLYVQEVVRLHEIPLSIVSDRNPSFTSRFGGSSSELLDEVGERQVEGPQMIQQMTDAVMRFGLKGKLSSRFIGPFEILEKVGEVAYHLALPPYISGIHDVFHVSLLRQYVADELHILHSTEVQLDQDLSYVERPIRILDRNDKLLRNKRIPLVMVQWQHRGTEEATWELERWMRAEHPELF